MVFLAKIKSFNQSLAPRKKLWSKEFYQRVPEQKPVSFVIKEVAHEDRSNWLALWITNQEVVKSVRNELLTFWF